MNPNARYQPLFVLILILAAVPWAAATDRVVFRRDGVEASVVGKVLVKAKDGSIALMARDGRIWALRTDEIVKLSHNKDPYRPLSRDEIAQALRKEMHGFEVYNTAHCLICHNIDPAFARWHGAVFERFYIAFTDYWTQRGCKLHEPDHPLVMVIFADRASFEQYAAEEVGEAVRTIFAYYSLKTNRIAMYDLIQLPPSRNSVSSNTAIRQALAQPGSYRHVATVIHEAAHQLANNCGLFRRYADVPYWLAQGLATYCEAPDLTSRRGWRSIGQLNQMRLASFRKSLSKRPSGRLASYIADNERLTDTVEGAEAYSEAWALTYYLSQKHQAQFVGYTQMLSRKSPFIWDSPKTRLEEFKRFFGNDLGQLETEFLEYMLHLK